MTQNYINCGSLGWRRIKSLDRMCAEQRQLQLWEANQNFRGRKQAVVSAYRFYLKSGKTTQESYELACKTQITAPPKPGTKFNIDSRTTWEIE